MKASRHSRITWAVCALLAGAVVPGVGLLAVRLRPYWVAKYHGEFAKLPGAALRHAPLANTNLHYANLQGAVFQVNDDGTEPDGGQGVDENAARALRWAERMLKKVFILPTRQTSALSPEEAAEAFEAVLEKYGDLPRAYIGLAKCDLRLGEATAAMGSLDQAIRLSRSDATARREQHEASHLLWVLRAASTQIPGGYRPLQVQRLNVPGRIPLWAVLAAKVETGDPSGTKFVEPRLALFQEHQGHHRKMWQSGVLRDPRLKAGAFDDVTLYVEDLTGDGIPEAAVSKFSIGGSWQPSHLDVFAWRGHQLAKVLGLRSSLPVWIEDIDHDGRYEIGNYSDIGWGMAHAEQPYWTDIYACKGGQYVLANASFPREFRGWIRRLRTVLKRHPGNFEILKYKGIVHEIEGRPRAAFAAHRSAARECAALLEDERDPGSHARLEWQLNDIRRRISKLKRRPEGGWR